MIDPAAAARARALLADPAVAGLLAVLAGAGEETRIVGGAIRNALMGRAASDIDLATTLLPEAMMVRAAAAGWHAVPTGIEHGTVTLVRDGRAIEVTTLREDIATDGRRATVRFGRDFAADAARRDFSINALSMGADGVIHDLFGGIDDLAAGRVRFIGDPAARLKEDRLRALRFLRFTASHARGAPDAAGFAAVLAERAGLKTLSGERVRGELFKLLAAPRGAEIIGFAEAPHRLVGDMLGLDLRPERLARAIGLAEDLGGGALRVPARLFGLSVVAERDIAQLRATLKLSNREVAALEALLDATGAFGAERAVGEIAYRFPDAVREAMVIFAIDRHRERDAHGFEAEIAAHLAAPRRFRVTGGDVLASGRSPGPEIGAILAEAEAAWIAAGMPPTRDAQLGLLAQVLTQR